MRTVSIGVTADREAFQRDLKERGVDDAMIGKLVSRMSALNDRIAADTLDQDSLQYA